MQPLVPCRQLLLPSLRKLGTARSALAKRDNSLVQCDVPVLVATLQRPLDNVLSVPASMRRPYATSSVRPLAALSSTMPSMPLHKQVSMLRSAARLWAPSAALQQLDRSNG